MSSIVCVDDSTTMRRMVTHSLQTLGGYQCFEAADGALGLEAVRLHKPQLVISDYHMPNLDGLGLVAAMRADAAFAGIPVLLLTTENSAELRAKAKAAGANGIMIKPFAPPVLLQTVQALLTR